MSLEGGGLPKKQISDRRRIQNKQAQKKYRERQKRTLQVLQEIATSSHVGNASKDGQRIEPGVSICTDALVRPDVFNDASLTQSHLPVFSGAENVGDSSGESSQSLSSLSGTNQQPLVFPPPKGSWDTEFPHESSIVHRILEQDSISLNEKTRLQLSEGTMTLKRILEAGLKALGHETSSKEVYPTSYEGEERSTNGTKLRTDKILVLKNAKNEYSTPLPDIRMNHIQIKQVMFVAACMANATCLSFNIGVKNCENVESPFYRDDICESDAESACLSEFTDVKTHLRPIATQMMYKHHPYIDVLPFPTFRERVIRLAYAEKPMIDEDDLCRDLQNDGLVCWGSLAGDGIAATGSGASWDIRSWEAQPWFLKKWWILIGGVEGEIYKQTQ